MTAIKNTDHTGQTVVYNGIKFDGASDNDDDVSNRSIRLIPPTISLSTTPEYDEAGRVVVHHTHVLTVNTIVYSTNTGEQTEQIEVIRRRLLEPGKLLTLTGMGLGFPESRSEKSISPQNNIIDVSWGPKPQQCTIRPFGGDIAHELVWVLEFRTAPCVAVGYQKTLRVKALNYETRWSNDAQGFTTRNIAGYVEVQQPQGSNRVGNGVSNPLLSAEKVRDQAILGFSVPNGFKRVGNVWNESMDRSRMDFSITDDQLRGTAYPIGIAEASGDFDESFDPFTFAKASASLRMTLTVAEGVHPSVAAIRFLQAAFAKQGSMRDRNTKGSVIAKNMFIRAGLFDNARTSSFGVQWQATGCIEDFLFDTPWEPIPNTDYSQWRFSVEHLWSNRGNSLTRPTPEADAIVDVCSTNDGRFGATDSGTKGQSFVPGIAQNTCDVSEAASWLDYDVKVTLKRSENKSSHRRTVSYNSQYSPSASTINSTNLKDALQPSFPSSATSEHVTETNGLPTQTVLLQMKGLRIKFRPNFPVLKSIDNRPVTPIGDRKFEESVVTKIGGCPVYSIRGYQMYEVKGYVDDFNTVENKTVCEINKANKAKSPKGIMPSASDGEL